MNAETATQNPFPTGAEQSANNGAALNGDANRVRCIAQSLHEAVDTLEQKIGSSSERVMGLQEEYAATWHATRCAATAGCIGRRLRCRFHHRQRSCADASRAQRARP